MKLIYFIILVLCTQLQAKSQDTCYSIQLMSYFPKTSKNIDIKVPKGCQIITINNISSVRCGCRDIYKNSKKDLIYYKKDFPKAIIAPTYKYRFHIQKKIEKKPTKKIAQPKEILFYSNTSNDKKRDNEPLFVSSFTKEKDTGIKKKDNRFNTIPVIIDEESNAKTRVYLNVRGLDAKGLQKNDSSRVTNQELISRLGIRYNNSINNNLFFDIDVRAVYEYLKYKDLTESNAYIELKRLSLEVPVLFNSYLSAKVGRMSFKDKRTWWYDNELDTLKLFYDSTILSWDVAVGTRLTDERASAGDQRVGLEGSKYVIAHLDYHYYYKHHFETFFVYEDNGQDKNPIGAVNDFTNRISSYSKLGWIGFRGYGELANSIEYWGDVAYVNGDIQNLQYSTNDDGFAVVVDASDVSVSGFGLDAGTLYKLDNFGVGIAYAYGSGDSSKSSQNIFLQSSISNNKSSMIGTTRYRYYGEMLDPQLSNMQIISLYAGTRIYGNTWIEANYHKYTQQVATTDLRSSSLIIQTNGIDKEIGEELDVILGGKYDNKTEAQLILSGFFGGDAFSGISQEKDGYRAIVDFKIFW